MASCLRSTQRPFLVYRALKEGDPVLTPTGRRAIVIEVHENGELTVEWVEDGQRARFKVNHLQRAE